MSIRLSRPGRKSFVVGLVTAAACLANYTVSDRIYEATAALSVPSGWNGIPTESAAENSTPEAVPEAILIRVVEQFQSVDGFEDDEFDSLDEELSDSLTVQLDPQQNLLELTYRSPDSTLASQVLQAVVAAYIEAAGNVSSDETPDLQELTKQAEAAEQERIAQQSKLAELRKRLEDPKLQQADASSQQKVEILSKALAESKLARLKSENRIQQVQKDMQAGTAVNVVVAGLDEGRAKQVVQAIMTQADIARELEQRKQEVVELAAVFGPRHPKMLQLNTQIEELTGQTNEADQRVLIAMDRSTMLLRSLELDLRQTRQFEDDLSEQLELERTALQGHAELLSQIQSTEQDVSERTQKETAARDAIASVSLTSEPSLSVSQPASVGENPISPRPMMHLLFGAVAMAVMGSLTWWAYSARSKEPDVETHRDDSAAEPEGAQQKRRLLRLARLQQDSRAA